MDNTKVTEKQWLKDSPGRITDYNKTLPVVELYYAVQSEGSRAGYPTVVIRTTGCTHRCWFGAGGWCDSWYTSIHPEKGHITFNDIIKMYDERPDITEMMLTGGSPTMQPDLVNELTHFANERGIFITIETEGSHFIKTDYPIGLVSLSPKFSNSIPKLDVSTPMAKLVDQKMIDQHEKFRLNYEAMKMMIEYHNDFHIKPVVNPIEMPEVWEEIKDLLGKIGVTNKQKVWIMPPGDTRNELIRVYPMVIKWCTDNGYNFIMDYYTRLLYKCKMHPEIYNSNIPLAQKIFLQDQLDSKYEGDFISLLNSMMDYAILPEVEDYENAAIIRDEIRKYNGFISNTPS
jgi:7-carboxy-7-deazaguanine synthase